MGRTISGRQIAERRALKAGKITEMPPLSPKEDAALKAYTKWNNTRAMRIYWKNPDERQAMKGHAAERGYGNASDWITAVVRDSLLPDAENPVILGLKEQLARLTEERDIARDERDDGRRRIRELEDELRQRGTEYGEILTQVRKLVEGKDK